MIPPGEVRFYAVSRQDVGRPIEEQPHVIVEAEGDGEAFEQVTRRAIKALSEQYEIPEHMLTIPEPVTRRVAQDVSTFKHSSQRSFKDRTEGASWGEVRQVLNKDERAVYKNAFVVSRDGGTGGIELLPALTDVSYFVGSVIATGMVDKVVSRVTAVVRPHTRVRRAARDWVRKSAGDHQLVDAYLSKRSRWATEELAANLGLSIDEGKWVLCQCGYDSLDDGLWVRSLADSAISNRKEWDL